MSFIYKKHETRGKYLALVSILLVSFCHTIDRVSSSPPIDYFVLTNEDDKGNPSDILAPLSSIYKSDSSDEADISKHQSELAQRVLGIVKNSSHSHDNDLIDIETTGFAWHLMEQQAFKYARHRIDRIKPMMSQLLVEANVSSSCRSSIDSWLDGFMKLDRWATRMWNSWGQFPPAGLLEGSFTDLGSYKGCLGIEGNEFIGEPKYCMLDYQPLVPSRPRFHSIFKRILDVDSKEQRLTAGDFESEHKVGSRVSAHEFSSTRFRLGKSNSSVANSRYNKRTIEMSTNSNISNETNIDRSSNEFQFKFKSKVLIDLAHKAQYFYYVKFRLGACLPSKCTDQDVQNLASTAGQRAILQTSQVNCMKRETTKLNSYQQVAISILSILALVALLGTVVDLLDLKGRRKSSENSLANWLLMFSLWTNARKLFAVESNGAHSDLECVHGLRFFSMVWVIYGHTILYSEYQSFTHFFEVVETRIPSFFTLPTLNANFSVDTFFVISGILTTYVTWDYTDGNPRKFNKFAFAISRYIRLTPQLAIVILCFFLLPLFGDGPLYKQVTDRQASLCYQGWLTNLLYLQTYTDSHQICIDPSWWLSIEMTFHMISIIIISVMIRNVTKGMLVNFAIAIGLTLWGAVIHYSNGFAIQYLPSIPQRYEVQSEQTKMFFHRPYPHAASYFIGTALGYVLANKSMKKLTPSQIWQGWFVSASGLIISLWGSYFWNLGASYNQLQATIYYHLCQILWPISVGWIILACSLGHGGPVNSILSARIFVPLGRITYMTYLSHALVIYFHAGSMNVPEEPSMMLFTYAFIANTTLSILLGIFLTVVYESPILNLQKNLFAYLINKFDPTKRDHTALESTAIQTKETTIINDRKQNGQAMNGTSMVLIPRDQNETEDHT